MTGFFDGNWVALDGNRQRVGIEDVVKRDRRVVFRQDLFAEVDLEIEEAHLDPEARPGPSLRGQVGIAQKPEAAIAGRQRQVGHEAQLLGLDRRRPPGRRRVVAPDVPHHLGWSRRRDPRPEKAPQVGAHRQQPALIQVLIALQED